VTPTELRAYLRAWWRAVDGDRLRHVSILTYFGTYGLILLGGREAVNAVLGVLPAAVRPGPLPPLATVLNLPVSVAWGVTSFAVALVAVALVLADARPSSDRRLRTGAGSEADGSSDPTGAAESPASASGVRRGPADRSTAGKPAVGAGEGDGEPDAPGSPGRSTDGASGTSETDDEADRAEPACPGGRSQ
jgi:hypothetical protein